MSLQQIVDRHYREVNANDFSDAGDIFSADVVTEAPGSGPLSGIEPFVAYGQGFHRAFPDGRIHGDRYVESGDSSSSRAGTRARTPARWTRRPARCRRPAGRWSCPSPTCSGSPTGRSPSTASTSTGSCSPSSACSRPLNRRRPEPQRTAGWRELCAARPLFCGTTEDAWPTCSGSTTGSRRRSGVGMHRLAARRTLPVFGPTGRGRTDGGRTSRERVRAIPRSARAVRAARLWARLRRARHWRRPLLGSVSLSGIPLGAGRGPGPRLQQPSAAALSGAHSGCVACLPSMQSLSASAVRAEGRAPSGLRERVIRGSSSPRTRSSSHSRTPPSRWARVKVCSESSSRGMPSLANPAGTRAGDRESPPARWPAPTSAGAGAWAGR